MSEIITLTTDFGLADEYVGVMKGVILGRTPRARIIDLTHDIEPQGIARAAHVIDHASRYFPAGTIHVVVVDPGVGTSRRLILVGARGQLFLAPDNGVLTLLLGEDDFGFARVVACQQLFLHPVSRTFHGRDILAPVAAALADNLEPAEVGPEIAAAGLTTLPLPKAERAARGEIRGEVIRVDRFGNLITNIPRALVNKLAPDTNAAGLAVAITGRTLAAVVETYGSVAIGTPAALFGSSDFLEIAVNGGNASQALNAAVGAEVTVSAERSITLMVPADK
ncbi:MAG: SAM-dependent chlorinase/fluorinase [Desulfobulbaceae bacterium]|nr:SAM-dependent chlorinase/fluorinase [Desulfobulbaceae bacterium]